MSDQKDEDELDKIKIKYLHKINTYKEFLKDERIDNDEYNELINDLLQVENIRDSIKKEDLKIKAELIVKSLSTITSVI